MENKERVSHWLARHMKHRVIVDSCHPETGPMMVRFFILRTERFGVYLHRFLRSDNDRHFHDHPWSFITILLSRGYQEHTPAGSFWRRRFSILYRPAEWGFITNRGWVDWKTYGKEWCND